MSSISPTVSISTASFALPVAGSYSQVSVLSALRALLRK